MNLGKISDEELKKTIREKLQGMMMVNGSRQMVIPVAQVECKLAEWWEFVSPPCPDDRAIICRQGRRVSAEHRNKRLLCF